MGSIALLSILALTAFPSISDERARDQDLKRSWLVYHVVMTRCGGNFCGKFSTAKWSEPKGPAMCVHGELKMMVKCCVMTNNAEHNLLFDLILTRPYIPLPHSSLFSHLLSLDPMSCHIALRHEPTSP